MSQAASPMRSTRARKTVPTYNLKVLSGLPTRRTSKRSIDDNDHPHNTNGADTHMSTSGSHGDSKASTPEDNLGPMFSNISSELTSPMRSPGLAALETSLEDEAVAAAAPGSTTASQNKGIYNCFNTQMHPKGHFYSANQLYARGIWIGYLSPDRMNEPFRGLPSFNKLKVNFSKFSPPHPQPVQGTARENRNAVCRGCVTSTSAVIALSEIQFFGKTKLVIMPLDGDDDAGVFAIMLPQKTDRSLNGLQGYRFYEISDEVANNFMLLTLRNSDRDAGTLETVLEVLPLQECLDIAQRLASHPASSDQGSARPTSFRTTVQGPSSSTTPASKGTITPDVEDIRRAGSRKRAKTSIKPTPVPELPKEGRQKSVSKLLKQTQDVKAPRLPDHNDNNTQATRQEGGVEIIPLDLTDDQAGRVHVIWPVRDANDDMDYEFIHTLAEFKTFKGLVTLLEEDTEAIPPIAEIVARTKTWRMTYEGADGANKAVVARKDSEVAFDRLQTLLAQLPLWQDAQARVHVELKSQLVGPPGSRSAMT